MIVIVGGGPAGRAAARLLPEARVIARPDATVWHAEPGLLWVETARGVEPLAFDHLLLCADEPLLLAALGCAFRDGRPVADASGATTAPGVFAAGRVLGARTAEEAAAQARIAASALLGQPGGGAIAARPRAIPEAERLDPVGIAALLEEPPGEARNGAALAQCALLGPVLPARPVGLAALAALATDPPAPRPVQTDAGLL